jgi:hypothetical protein
MPAPCFAWGPGMTSRRAHLARLGLAATAGLAAAATTSVAPAAPAGAGGRRRPEQEIVLSARRRQITIPAVPPLGVTYVATLDLFNADGTAAGTGASGASVVDVTLDGPVVLAAVVLQLADGEIHYQRIMNRFGAFPRTATGAILGGTGTYQGIRGQVSVSWPDDEVIDLVVQPVE